jgi:hypothetical protein
MVLDTCPKIMVLDFGGTQLCILPLASQLAGQRERMTLLQRTTKLVLLWVEMDSLGGTMAFTGMPTNFVQEGRVYLHADMK